MLSPAISPVEPPVSLHPAEATACAVIGIDARGTIRSFSHGAEELCGWSRGDVMGRPFVDTLFGAGADALRHVVTSLLAGPPDAAGCVERVFPMKSRDDQPRELAWKLVRVPAIGVNDVRLLAFGDDRTEEQALARKQRVTERLATLAALGASLAHAIRNPLNGALLHVTLLERALLRQQADAESQETLAIIEKEIQRLSRLVGEFLEFAQPATPSIAPVATRPLARRLEERMAERLSSAGVFLDVDVDDVHFPTDGSKVERALEQLLLNAVEASAAGERIALRIGASDRSLALRVEDHGPGIGDAELSIFDPFVSTKSRGTGLGLAIAQRIAADLGGRIDVDSRPGRTIFCMTLPAPPPTRTP